MEVYFRQSNSKTLRYFYPTAMVHCCFLQKERIWIWIGVAFFSLYILYFACAKQYYHYTNFEWQYQLLVMTFNVIYFVTLWCSFMKPCVLWMLSLLACFVKISDFPWNFGTTRRSAVYSGLEILEFYDWYLLSF